MRKELYHEIKVLSKYYEVDEENKTVILPFKYERASDLIDSSIETKSNYVISEQAMVDIVDKISTIPPIFKVKLDLIIDDYEEYDKEILLESLNDYLELTHYSIIREKKIFLIQAILLLAVGISILVFNNFAKSKILSEESVLTEVFDIVAWVFVWQATTVAFLTPSEFDVNTNRFKLRVKKITFYDKDKNVLLEEDTLEKFKEWVGNKKKEKFERLCLLLSGGALLVSAAMSLVSGITSITNIVEYIQSGSVENLDMIIFLATTSIVLSVLQMLIAISALSLYRGRGPFSNKARYVFLPLMIIILVLELTTLFSLTTLGDFFSAIISILAAIGYIIGTILSFFSNQSYKKRKQKEKTNIESD